MFSPALPGKPLVWLLLALLFTACSRSPEERFVTLNERPTESPRTANLQPRNTRFAITATLDHAQLGQFLAERLPQQHEDTGQRRVCKKVLGLKVCSTVNWQYRLIRLADPQFTSIDNRMMVIAPVEMTGSVGLTGDLARLAGLQNQPFSGSVNLAVAFALDLDDRWCPAVQANVLHRWLDEPVLELPGGIDFNLTSVLDDAIAAQTENLDQRINEEIDCDITRKKIAAVWRNYSIPVDLEGRELYVNLSPEKFYFSGVKVDDDSIGVSLAIEAPTIVASEPLEKVDVPLPGLERLESGESRTEFDLIIRLPYTELNQELHQYYQGQSYQYDSVAGEVDATLGSFELFSTEQGLGLQIGFKGHIPPDRAPVEGVVYLQANPIVDQQGTRISLQDLTFDNQSDSTVLNALTSLFNGRIITALEERATFDLTERRDQLQAALHQQLDRFGKESDVHMEVTDLELRLVNVVPEAQTLAVMVRAEADISAQLSVEALDSAVDDAGR